MKLTEITKTKKTPDGTYAGVKFNPKTIKAIEAFIKDNGIPNPIRTEKIHTTLLYSKKYLPDYEARGKLDDMMVGKPTRFEKWPSQPGDDGKVAMYLVLKYDCPDLIARHKDLMDEHDAKYDFNEYKPHITFSYDVAGLQCKDLPKFEEDIEIVEEYSEDLNLDWAKKNTKKDK